jgi:hypothetical protein
MSGDLVIWGFSFAPFAFSSGGDLVIWGFSFAPFVSFKDEAGVAYCIVMPTKEGTHQPEQV